MRLRLHDAAPTSRRTLLVGSRPVADSVLPLLGFA